MMNVQFSIKRKVYAKNPAWLWLGKDFFMLQLYIFTGLDLSFHVMRKLCLLSG